MYSWIPDRALPSVGAVEDDEAEKISVRRTKVIYPHKNFSKNLHIFLRFVTNAMSDFGRTYYHLIHT
jgi:hypothetical protein